MSALVGDLIAESGLRLAHRTVWPAGAQAWQFWDPGMGGHGVGGVPWAEGRLRWCPGGYQATGGLMVLRGSSGW
jgi:hypothetical protein